MSETYCTTGVYILCPCFSSGRRKHFCVTTTSLNGGEVRVPTTMYHQKHIKIQQGGLMISAIGGKWVKMLLQKYSSKGCWACAHENWTSTDEGHLFVVMFCAFSSLHCDWPGARQKLCQPKKKQQLSLSISCLVKWWLPTNDTFRKQDSEVGNFATLLWFLNFFKWPNLQ